MVVFYNTMVYICMVVWYKFHMVYICMAVWYNYYNIWFIYVSLYGIIYGLYMYDCMV